MKITNWRKKLATAIVAAGIMVPGVASAGIITVPDADFKTFDVTTIAGTLNYAYAVKAAPKGSYRPASPWVDDLGQATGTDNAASNWLYNSAFSTAHAKYPYPHGDASDQVMFGHNNFSGQVLSDTYQADTTYTYSVWAQGYNGAGTSGTRRLFLYLFNGDVPTTFSDASASLRQLFSVSAGNFQSRATSSTDAASQANWTQLSASLTVPAGSPLIGQHIGIGMYLYSLTAVDDVSLTSVSLAVPEPTTVILLGLGGVMLVVCRRQRD